MPGFISVAMPKMDPMRFSFFPTGKGVQLREDLFRKLVDEHFWIHR